MRQRWTVAVLAVGLLLAVSGRASADLVATIQGNDCSGLFGTEFASCKVPDLFDPNMSPVVVKFNANGSVSEVNSGLFPTISGDEFSFSFGSNGSGTWTYSPGADDPATLVSFYVAKGGNYFNLFNNAGNTNSWFAPFNPVNGQPTGLSHLTFYQGPAGVSAGPMSPVPEPGSLLLLASGLAAGVARLRSRSRNRRVAD